MFVAADSALQAVWAEALTRAGEVTREQTRDVNYVMPDYVLNHLPLGMAGIFIAAVMAAAMSSIAAELNSLSTATVIDFYQRWFKPQATDAQMLWYGIDRTQRTTTGEARVPRDQFPNMKASLASFKKLRAEMMKVAKDSQEDLRGRQFLTASQDLYQWFLMISTHSQRHIMQIREVKAHKGFPKK